MSENGNRWMVSVIAIRTLCEVNERSVDQGGDRTQEDLGQCLCTHECNIAQMKSLE